ncbi:MAG TPA: 2OG-Fe(II) oxygenase [Leptolyngbyaceae cyanobacterium M33_DOE_097]|uniref:2OG-Fe(II) oxygenase n=1 Tax=Oscillatoriales cyanobacterium SpSt-418 TaxID=2282169 RepID=A0A7C3PH64_9CYAN|nr:2OG-Fe(II) oxygenase [Leptolyngbyaceae cyanobacterium M33_DOE_097]
MVTNVVKFRFDADYLDDLAEKHREAYANAQPFPHIVFENFLPEPVLEDVLEEFPKPEQIEWQSFKTAAEKKLASRSEKQMGDATRFLLYQFNSSIFISFLEKLTGIEGIIPDPHFEGGGLHQIEPGGFLKMHVDFNRHRRLNLDRRLNLLLYLNKNWQEEYGGHLELWDKEITQCKERILPVFNRCVIFTTTDFTYHGHPEPLTCPEGWSRKSLALYYYTNGRPASELNGVGKHSTIFQERPNESFMKEIQKKETVKTVLKKFIPPILTETRKPSDK